MWTPRRILLLLGGLLGFTAAYLVYTAVLGGVDGLPDLPGEYLVAADDVSIPLSQPTDLSSTILQLQRAFGVDSPEVTDTITYKTQLEEASKGLVFACGSPKIKQSAPSNFVPISPMSVAIFGKPRPAHLRQPGEVTEITTIHADQAIFEFDRPVSSMRDIVNGAAKLVGMELMSVPDDLSTDPRHGKIWITNNQRSADAGQYLVFKTPGPLFYRPADDGTGKQNPDAPQIWSTAAVEIHDRKNLPRPLRGQALTPVVLKPDDLRRRTTVANILLGISSPPPTVTAEGLKIFLQPQDDKLPPEKRNSTGYAGVRQIQLVANVKMNLWSDGATGGFAASGTDAPTPTPPAEPPVALAGVAGGLADAAAIARKLNEKTLLVLETPGSFRYDYAAATARFESTPVNGSSKPAGAVTAYRLTARGGEDNLICKQLVIEFSDNPGAGGAAKPKPAASGATQGMNVKSMTATGDHVFVAAAAEQLLAQGTELRYTTDPAANRSVTILRGSPVDAVRERHRMQAGDAKTPAEIHIMSTEPPAGSKDKKVTTVAVHGQGWLKLFDPASNDNNLIATWGTSLVQERQNVGGKDQDLFKFEGPGSSFRDIKGGMQLTAEKLWLWLGAPENSTPRPAGKNTGPAATPQRLVAIGKVDGESKDLKIRRTDQLTVWFRDLPPSAADLPPARTAAVVNSSPIVLAAFNDPIPTAKPKEKEKEKAPEKPKPPMYLSARVINTWVVRSPQPAAPTTKPAAGSTTGPDSTSKYELERAQCIDRVIVHQDPSDPAKTARGVDIFGNKLNVDHSRAGSVLTVHGTDRGPAQVYFEDLSLFGPEVVIDQPNNQVSVDGRGRLIMPGSTDMSGAKTDRPMELDIQWLHKMRFEGARSRAEFVGQVLANQRPAMESPAPAPLPLAAANKDIRRVAYKADTAPAKPGEPEKTWSEAIVVCHQLNVTFDRPIYFNQFRQENSLLPTNAPPKKDTDKPEERPKLRTAACSPMPDDYLPTVKAPERPIEMVMFDEQVFGPGGKTIRRQRVTARQLNVHVEDREQVMDASGPGEVRILQLGSKDATAQQDNMKPAKADDQEMKLTYVKFQARFSAKETNKVYQEAKFDDGAKVLQIPAEDIDITPVEHALPQRGVFLECDRSLTVATTKVRKDAPAKQRLEAVGNARFRTDEYQGTAATIVHDAGDTIFNGSRTRPARLYRNRRLGEKGDDESAEQIVYTKDKHITTKNSTTGSYQFGN